MNNIDDMIEILSENPPEFLDITIKSHNIAFEYTSHLLLLSKILCRPVGGDYFIPIIRNEKLRKLLND